MRRDRLAARITQTSAISMAGVCEYICSEVLELAGNVAQEGKKVRIVPRHLMLAVAQDEELSKMLGTALWSQTGVVPKIDPALVKGAKGGKAADKLAQASQAATQEV